MDSLSYGTGPLERGLTLFQSVVVPSEKQWFFNRCCEQTFRVAGLLKDSGWGAGKCCNWGLPISTANSMNRRGVTGRNGLNMRRWPVGRRAELICLGCLDPMVQLTENG